MSSSRKLRATSMALGKALSCSSLLILAGCGGGGGGTANPAPAPSGGNSAPAETPPLFVDVSTTSGIDFTHGYVNPTENSMPESFAGGAAAGDYDNDGDIDLF